MTRSSYLKPVGDSEFRTVEPETHLQLSEKVAMQLREQIVSGQIKNGEFLRIESIAKTLGVSPTPVREGLLLLQSESLVRLIPRRGFRVNSFSKQDLFDLFWAQATLGAELARRAANRMTIEDLDRLTALQPIYEQSIADGDERETGDLATNSIELSTRQPTPPASQPSWGH
jgi:DNA-binding GntR family transcriptional regulator